MPGQNQFNQGIAIVIIILNSLAFFLLVTILSVYFIRWKQIASFPIRLSFYLCTACLGQSVCVIILNPYTSKMFKQQQYNNAAKNYCIAVAAFKCAFDLSEIFWTTLIIYSIYASIVLKKSLDKNQKYYFIIAYLFPLVISCIPIIFKQYNYDTYNCWLVPQDRKNNLQTQMILKVSYFYGPLWLLFFVNVFFAIQTYRTLKNLGIQQTYLSFFKKLLLFPLILLVTGLISTLNLIYYWFSKEHNKSLEQTGIIFLNLYCLLNAIAYGFNPIIIEQVRIILGMQSERFSISQRSDSISSAISRQDSKLTEMMNLSQ